MALTWGAAKIRLHRHRRLPPFAEGAKDGAPRVPERERKSETEARPNGPCGKSCQEPERDIFD
jgi:hypothetical protein